MVNITNANTSAHTDCKICLVSRCFIFPRFSGIAIRPSQTQLFEESARRRVVFAEPLLRTVVTVFLAEECDALSSSMGKVLWI
jgi:hypothetical protein